VTSVTAPTKTVQTLDASLCALKPGPF
jgi:hypothetical protein